MSHGMRFPTMWPGFYTKLNVWGPWDSPLNMMGVPSLKLGVPSFYISFKFWKVVYPSVKAQCCPQVSNFEGHVWPPSNIVVCATCKASDQPAHTGSLIRAFASRLIIL